jgi:hypothetical protein
MLVVDYESTETRCNVQVALMRLGDISVKNYF